MSAGEIAAYLQLIAAKATQLSIDHAAGRLWPDDLSRGIAELEQQIAQLRRSFP